MQTRILHLVRERIGQSQAQKAELEAFTSQLQTAAARLGVHTPVGACDDDCGGRSESPQLSGVAPERLIPLTQPINPDIACSLQPNSVGDRIPGWDRVLSSATGRKLIRVGCVWTRKVTSTSQPYSNWLPPRRCAVRSSNSISASNPESARRLTA